MQCLNFKCNAACCFKKPISLGHHSTAFTSLHRLFKYQTFWSAVVTSEILFSCQSQYCFQYGFCLGAIVSDIGCWSFIVLTLVNGGPLGRLTAINLIHVAEKLLTYIKIKLTNMLTFKLKNLQKIMSKQIIFTTLATISFTLQSL